MKLATGTMAYAATMDADAETLYHHAQRCLVDGRVDADELKQLLAIATADGTVTVGEKIQLAAVLDQIMATAPDPGTAALVRRIRLALKI